MVIASITAMLNSASLTGTVRLAVQKIACRMLVRCTTYDEEKATLESYGKEIARAVNRWYKDTCYNDDVSLRLWRGVHGAFDMDDDAVAFSYNVSPQDFAFIKSNLSLADVRAMQNSDLAWRQPPITKSQIDFILNKVSSHIRTTAHFARYIADIDRGWCEEQFASDLRYVALRNIHKYENTRSVEYIINTCRTSITNHANDVKAQYNTERRCSKGREVRDTGRTRADGTPVVEYVNHAMQGQLTLIGNDGSPMENPEVASAAARIPLQDEALAVSQAIMALCVSNPRVGKYLKHVVAHVPHPDLDEYLESVMPPVEPRRPADPTAVFDRVAYHTRKFFGVTQSDIDAAMRELSRTYTALPDNVPIISVIRKEEEEVIDDGFEEIPEVDASDDSTLPAGVVDVTPRIPMRRFSYA